MKEQDSTEPTNRPKRRLSFWLIAIPVLLIVLFIWATEFSWTFHAFLLLLSGWWYFIEANWIALHFNAERVITSLVVILLAGAGLHLLARAWHKYLRPAAPPWKVRSSLCLTVLALLLGCAAISVAGLAHQIAWLSSQPMLHMDISSMLRQSSHARQLAMIINYYAEEHAQQYPPDLKTLRQWMESEDPDSRMTKLMLYQPIPHDTPESWLYFQPSDEDKNDATALLLAAPRPRKDKRLVVTMDHSTIFMPENEFQVTLRLWKATRLSLPVRGPSE